MMHKHAFVWIDKLTAKIFKPRYRVEFQRCELTAQGLHINLY